MRTQTRIKIKSAIPRPVWNMISSTYRRNLYSRYKKDMTRHPDSMTVFCPCCGLKFREFVKGDYEEYNGYYDLTLFEGVRQDVCCPVCESLPRHRIEILWCEEHMDLLQGKQILYFAIERSVKLWMKRKGLKCTTADLFAEADLKLDIQDTGLADNSYDVIFCNHVLEHVNDYMKALRELRRILRPGGVLICSFPISPDIDYVDEDPSVTSEEERLKRFGQSDHVRLFGINAGRFMEDAGFEVNVIDGNECPEEILPVTAPCKYDINRLFLCRKV